MTAKRWVVAGLSLFLLADAAVPLAVRYTGEHPDGTTVWRASIALAIFGGGILALLLWRSPDRTAVFIGGPALILCLVGILIAALSPEFHLPEGGRPIPDSTFHRWIDAAVVFVVGGIWCFLVAAFAKRSDGRESPWRLRVAGLMLVMGITAWFMIATGREVTGPFKCAEYVVTAATPPTGSECGEGAY